MPVFDFPDFEVFNGVLEWDTAWAVGFGAELFAPELFVVDALRVDFFFVLLFDDPVFGFAAGVSCARRTPAANMATVKAIDLKGKTQNTKVGRAKL